MTFDAVALLATCICRPASKSAVSTFSSMRSNSVPVAVPSFSDTLFSSLSATASAIPSIVAARSRKRLATSLNDSGVYSSLYPLMQKILQKFLKVRKCLSCKGLYCVCPVFVLNLCRNCLTTCWLPLISAPSDATDANATHEARKTERWQHTTAT